MCFQKNYIEKSIAVYYYTKNENGIVDFEGDAEYSTIWHKTPNVYIIIKENLYNF